MQQSTKQFEIGQRVVSNVLTGVCDINEIGVVYEHYDIGHGRGVSVIFERGGYDGFSKSEQEMMLTSLDEFDERNRGYRFTNVIKLSEDFNAHRFNFGDRVETEDTVPCVCNQYPHTPECLAHAVAQVEKRNGATAQA